MFGLNGDPEAGLELIDRCSILRPGEGGGSGDRYRSSALAGSTPTSPARSIPLPYVDQIRTLAGRRHGLGGLGHAAVEWFHRERLAGRTPELSEVLRIFEGDRYAQNLEPLVFSSGIAG